MCKFSVEKMLMCTYWFDKNIFYFHEIIFVLVNINKSRTTREYTALVNQHFAYCAISATCRRSKIIWGPRFWPSKFLLPPPFPTKNNATFWRAINKPSFYLCLVSWNYIAACCRKHRNNWGCQNKLVELSLFFLRLWNLWCWFLHCRTMWIYRWQQH